MIRMFNAEPIFFVLMSASFVLAVVMPDLYARICFVIVGVLYYKTFY